MHPNQEILSRDELTQLLRRNSTEKLPEYELMWAGHRILPMADLEWVRLQKRLVGRRGTFRQVESQSQWEARLNSKTWRVQLRGKKEAHVVQRITKVLRGGAAAKREWTEVPLNSRAL